MSPESLYRPADFGMLRTPLLPMRNSLPSLGVNVDDATEAQLASFLRAGATDPVLREAIALSTPSLALFLDQVVRNAPVRTAQLRKAALSVARYVIRAGSRSTPFGVLAGVAPVHFDSCVSVVPGTGHTKHVGIDGDWLVELLRVLECRREIMMGLNLVVHHEVVSKGRGVHFYARSQRQRSTTRTPPVRKVLRSHVVVDHVLRCAARPIRAGLLLDRLEEALPDQSSSNLTSLVEQLVRSRVLMTSLQPPLDAGDPLEYMLSQLAVIPDESVRALVRQLRELQTCMRAYQATAVGRGTEELAAVRRAALEVSDHTPAVQVDLRLSERVTLPRHVAREAAAAVDALWRMSPRESTQHARLQSYRDRFEDVYGPDALLPLTVLLDAERGLGHPDAWSNGSKADGDPVSAAGATEEARREECRRTQTLAELAWPSGLYASEVVIGEATVDALARTSPTLPLTSTEAVFDLVAGSPADIEGGDYRLVLRGGSHRAAAMFGRFGRLLPELDEPLRDVFAHGAAPAVVPAQLVTQVASGFAYLVANAPRWADRVVRMGEFGSAGEYDQGAGCRTDHDATDLLIGVRDGRFRVVSASTGEELQLAQANVMEPGKLATPAARFLHEVSKSQGRPWQLWSWGEFSVAPRLPRIRYGQAILSLERWRASREMVEAGRDRHRWRRAFEVWRERYEVPDEVAIGTTDKRLVLDLRSPLHQQLLHEEMRKSPTVRIEEASARAGSGAGWLHGRVTEVVLPLLAAAPQHGPLCRERSRSASTGAAGPLTGASAPWSPATSATEKVYPVGSEWLYAKIYSSAHLHDEILAERMSHLLGAIRGDVDRSFFLRYRDPDDHIRLRLHGTPDRLVGRVLPTMAAWAEEMRDLGLVREWSLHTYVPEVSRYGGAGVMAAAESVFHADSRVATAQLSMLRGNRSGADQELALALNLVDIVRGTCREDWASWLVTEIPRDTGRERFRARRAELRDLVGADREAMATFCGGSEVADAWHSRAAALREYHKQLTGRNREAGTKTQYRVLKSLLHMHHNRAKGIDVESEAAAHAMARGFAELTINAARFQRP